MKYKELAKSLLNEIRSSNVLYHFTKGPNLVPILKENSLKVDYGKKRNPKKGGEKEWGISFTRTKKTSNEILPFAKNRSIRMVFNRGKLNNDYEIVSRGMTTGKNEREETVMTKEINPIRKYIIKIDVSLKQLVENNLSKLNFNSSKDFVSSEINEPKDVLPKKSVWKITKSKFFKG